MTTLYVREQGSKLSRNGRRIIVENDGEQIHALPIEQVDQIVLLGNIEITTPLMTTLLERTIDLVFLSSRGQYRGRLKGKKSRHAKLRHKQMHMLTNDMFALPIGRSIVMGKIDNQRVLLQRQRRRLAEKSDTQSRANLQRFDRAMEGMAQTLNRVPLAGSFDALRGHEGSAARAYFQAIRSLLAAGWGFEKRRYYPAPDPFNALLSFLYSLLLKDVLAAVYEVGFDPYIGCLHTIDYGRPSLALDLVEEWRPLLADALAMELVNRGALQPEQFVRTNNPKRPIELGEDNIRRVIHAYEMRLETKRHHPMAGGQTSIRQAMVWQVRQFAQVILGERAVYEPIHNR